jgi:chromosomal replication initiation ATPase DnaA
LPSEHAEPGNDACSMWQAALSELELQMTKAAFATWIRPVELLAWESEGDDHGGKSTRIVLGTPNEYVRDWLENRLYTPIQRTLSGIAGHPVAVEFEVRDRFAEQDSSTCFRKQGPASSW